MTQGDDKSMWGGGTDPERIHVSLHDVFGNGENSRLFILRGSHVAQCLTRNPGVLGLSRTGSSGSFSWECPWARYFRAQPSTGETQESMNNVSCCRGMTEILLKAA